MKRLEPQHGVGDPLLSMTTLCGTPLTAMAFLKKRRAAPRFRRFDSMSQAFYIHDFVHDLRSLWCVSNHPAVQCCMVNLSAVFGRHFLKVSIGTGIAQQK